jgi:predicted transcriptional regulator
MAAHDRITGSMALTVQLPADLRDRLDKLATATGRSEAHLAVDAIASFVASELAIVEAIEAARVEVREGKTVPHEEVMRKARAIILGAKNGQ